MEGHAHMRRIEKEIELLSSLDPEKYTVMAKEFQNVVIVRIGSSAECFPELREDPAIKSVNVEIILDEQFPFMAPILLCKTKFCTPSLNDGRDLTLELLENKIWSPIITLVDLIKAFPRLVSTVIKEKRFHCGCFHLGSLYHSDFWIKNPNFKIIRCRNISLQGKPCRERRILLLENAFLLLEPKIDQPGQNILVAWAFLESLVGIRLYSEKYLTFSWLASGETSYTWELSLEILDNTRESFQLLLSKVKSLQDVKIFSQKEIADLQQKMGGIKEEEVTLKSIMLMDINEINEKIAIYESNFSNELTISTIQTLMLLYQQAIEYYSALGHPVHEVYLKKMHDMIQSKEIQEKLAESPSAPDKPKTEIHKIEEEEKCESGEEDFEDAEP